MRRFGGGAGLAEKRGKRKESETELCCYLEGNNTQIQIAQLKLWAGRVNGCIEARGVQLSGVNLCWDRVWEKGITGCWTTKTASQRLLVLELDWGEQRQGGSERGPRGGGERIREQALNRD